jgi:hypothetical protein
MFSVEERDRVRDGILEMAQADPSELHLSLHGRDTCSPRQHPCTDGARSRFAAVPPKPSAKA